MGKSDVMLRNPSFDKGDHDNEDITFLKPEWLAQGSIIIGLDTVQETIKGLQAELVKEDLPKGIKEESGFLRY